MKKLFKLRLSLIGALALIASICFSIEAKSQAKMRNLINFDKRKYHFGMILGLNSSSFFMDRNLLDSLGTDSILGVVPVPQSGFDIHMLASYDMTPNFHIRFQPGLSFQDRSLEYSFLNSDLEVETEIKRTESVFLEFPLLFKLRTDRVGNFAAYAIVGGKYGLDMQTQKDTENVGDEKIVKLSRTDYAIEAGGGFDFFLTYFKLGLELKTAFGLPDLLIQEGNLYTSPINQLRTRAFMFSITFEG